MRVHPGVQDGYELVRGSLSVSVSFHQRLCLRVLRRWYQRDELRTTGNIGNRQPAGAAETPKGSEADSLFCTS